MLELASDEIHVWLSFYEEINEARLRSYHDLLDSPEKEQNSRFHFAKDRRQHLVARALARTVLSRYAPLTPKEWAFTTNAHGRPETANPEGRGIGITFNISHTDGLIVLGVSTRRALGADVENIHVRHASMDVAKRFFAPEEVAALAALPSDEQQERFFEYWTFKESYLKARGVGLSLPLNKFSFRFPHDRAVIFATDLSLRDDAARWHFWQVRPRPDLMLAVCAERIGDARVPRLVIRKAVPAAGDDVLALDVSRVTVL
jgi:4'-phosphopantetheinyl transferase